MLYHEFLYISHFKGKSSVELIEVTSVAEEITADEPYTDISQYSTEVSTSTIARSVTALTANCRLFHPGSTANILRRFS